MSADRSEVKLSALRAFAAALQTLTGGLARCGRAAASDGRAERRQSQAPGRGVQLLVLEGQTDRRTERHCERTNRVTERTSLKRESLDIVLDHAGSASGWRQCTLTKVDILKFNHWNILDN